jgi:hypothetical protein
LCSGGSLNPTTPTVTFNSSTITVSGWQLEIGVGSLGHFANISIPYTVGFADNGKNKDIMQPMSAVQLTVMKLR